MHSTRELGIRRLPTLKPGPEPQGVQRVPKSAFNPNLTPVAKEQFHTGHVMRANKPSPKHFGVHKEGANMRGGRRVGAAAGIP